MNRFWDWMREENNTVPKEPELDERMLIGYMIEYLAHKKIDWEVGLPFYDEKFNIDKLFFWLKEQIKRVED